MESSLDWIEKALYNGLNGNLSVLLCRNDNEAGCPKDS